MGNLWLLANEKAAGVPFWAESGTTGPPLWSSEFFFLAAINQASFFAGRHCWPTISKLITKGGECGGAYLLCRTPVLVLDALGAGCRIKSQPPNQTDRQGGGP